MGRARPREVHQPRHRVIGRGRRERRGRRKRCYFTMPLQPSWCSDAETPGMDSESILSPSAMVVGEIGYGVPLVEVDLRPDRESEREVHTAARTQTTAPPGWSPAAAEQDPARGSALSGRARAGGFTPLAEAEVGLHGDQCQGETGTDNMRSRSALRLFTAARGRYGPGNPGNRPIRAGTRRRGEACRPNPPRDRSSRPPRNC